LQSSQRGSTENNDDESKANDCTAHPRELTIVLFRAEGADCHGKYEKAISKEKNRP
jgi:hypothetical protein